MRSMIVTLFLLAVPAPASADQDPQPAKDKLEENLETLAEAEKLVDEATAAATKAGGVGPIADPTLVEMMKHKERMQELKAEIPNVGQMIAVPITISFFIAVILMVVLPLRLRAKRRAIDAELQAKAVEAGLQFIPEIPAAPLRKRNDKRTGILVASLGAGGLAAFALIGEMTAAAFGVIPLFLGVAYYVVGSMMPNGNLPNGEKE
jgi:hypothetical protein